MTRNERVTVEFAGEYFPVEPGGRFTVGREGDLAIDENLFLHRHFLEISHDAGLWWLSNIGTRLTKTKEKQQVTSAFAGGALVLLLIGAGLGLARGARLP